jgi:hypothetical protein
MKPLIRSSTIALFTIALLSTQWGCSHVSQTKFASYPEEVTKQLGRVRLREAKLHQVDLGTVGLASGRFKPDVRLPMTKGRVAGAMKGAGKGAAYAIVQSSGGVFPLLEGAWGIALAPFYALYGGIRGAKQAGARVALEKALAELKIQGSIRSQLFELALQRVPRPLVLLEEGGPATPNEKVNYLFSATEGIDTVLEVSVLRIGLRSDEEKDIDPPLLISMDVHIKVIKVEDHTVIYADTIGWEDNGPLHNAPEWSANDGQMFRKESERSCQRIAMEILEDLFGSPL